MALSTVFICALIVIGTFLFMEFVAWFSHKYIMHGFLWTWHRSHHKSHNHTLEQNDLFALVFSLPCIGLFYYSTLVINSPYLTAVAIGIFCYGVFYLIFHDIIVHQRFKWRPKKRSKYLDRIINAHYIHHKTRTKEDGEAFGFLYAPKKYEGIKANNP
jgi:beta-carotene 3-hydroxylase